MTNRDIEQQRAAAKAELDDLLARGLVRAVLLFPEMFGGTDDPRNVTYLPPACIEEKEQFDALVQHELERLEPISYTATPAYDGPSMVPARVTLTAQGTGLDLVRVIEVAPHKSW